LFLLLNLLDLLFDDVLLIFADFFKILMFLQFKDLVFEIIDANLDHLEPQGKESAEQVHPIFPDDLVFLRQVALSGLVKVLDDPDKAVKDSLFGVHAENFAQEVVPNKEGKDHEVIDDSVHVELLFVLETRLVLQLQVLLQDVDVQELHLLVLGLPLARFKVLAVVVIALHLSDDANERKSQTQREEHHVRVIGVKAVRVLLVEALLGLHVFDVVSDLMLSFSWDVLVAVDHFQLSPL
jgi:hypothetical protein